MKKIKIVSFSLLFSLFLCGSIFSSVELRLDKPIVDLDKVLIPENIGKPGSRDSGASVSDEHRDKPQKDTDKDAASIPREEEEKEESGILILVRGKSIICSGRTFTYMRESESAAGFDTFLASLSPGAGIEVRDEFAESHAFKYVVESVRALDPGVRVDSPELFAE